MISSVFLKTFLGSFLGSFNNPQILLLWETTYVYA